jgi:hypothetical protein
MRMALVATLGHPEWWAMALAGFLVRGGIVLVLLPIVPLPSPGQLANAFAPTIDSLAFEGLTVARLASSAVLAAAISAILAAAGLVGAWFDLALVREAAADEDLELGWQARDGSVRRAFGLRLGAHLPTMLAIVYATVRLVQAGYDELLSPGDAAVPLAWRVIERAPDAVILLLLAWLAGEAVGGLAARRLAAGQPARGALLEAARQLLRPRRLATLVVTTLAVGAVLVPFGLGVGGAWEHLRGYLLDDVTNVQLGAALLVLVASWILGIAALGAVLAWRATAWTAEVEAPQGDARTATT